MRKQFKNLDLTKLNLKNLFFKTPEILWQTNIMQRFIFIIITIIIILNFKFF
jgi:hypothetical protein